MRTLVPVALFLISLQAVVSWKSEYMHCLMCIKFDFVDKTCSRKHSIDFCHFIDYF